MGLFVWGAIAGLWTAALLIGAAVTGLKFLGKPARSRRAAASLPTGPLVGYPTDCLFAVFDTSDAATAALADIEQLGVVPSDTMRLSGEGGAARIDASGERHGLLGRALRIAQAMTLDLDHAVRYEEEVRNGHCVVGVHVRNEATLPSVEDAFRRNGAYFMNWYGRFHFESVSASA